MKFLPYATLSLVILSILRAFPIQAEVGPCPTFETHSVNCSEASNYGSTSHITEISESQAYLFFGQTIFIHANRAITLTTDHSLITNACRYIGKESIWSKAPAERPIDQVSKMAWYLSVLHKHPGNYLLANFNYDSLWSYEC